MVVNTARVVCVPEFPACHVTDFSDVSFCDLGIYKKKIDMVY